jgi:predicted transcriptional regulator of viral defense system
MTSTERFKILVDSGKTVFTAQDLRILWDEPMGIAKINAARMSGKKVLRRISRGYYSLRKEYNEYELANRIVSPSYVSFQSALFYAGVNFQERGRIDSAARFNYKKKIGEYAYFYYTLKDELLFNMEGVRIYDGISIASPERAILDCLYLGFLPDIDNKEKINTPFLRKLSIFYPKTVIKKVERLL